MWRGLGLKAGQANEKVWLENQRLPHCAPSPIAVGPGWRYIAKMTFVSIKDAQLRLADLARRVKQGETIVVTQDGQPLMDIVPHRPSKAAVPSEPVVTQP